MVKFCEEHNLRLASMYDLARGKTSKSRDGWTKLWKDRELNG